MNYIERYWRDATPEDAIKEPPMVARFRDECCQDWVIDKLIYWDRSDTPWHREDGFCYDLCQVYDAPDPGEGWRLIDISTESHEVEKEFWHAGQYRWIGVSTSEKFFGDLVYRRRITPAVTYFPFTWEDRDQLRGRWYRVTLSCGEIRECQIEFFRLDRGVFFVGSFPSEQLLEKGATFLDTGEPVGKKVAQ